MDHSRFISIVKSDSSFPSMLSSSFRRFFSNPFAKKMPLESVGRLILTASVKGGVGKSTVALNTAISLSELGNRVGLLDADLYGPSVPTMMNTNDVQMQQVKEGQYLPVPAYGIETVSIGNMMPRGGALCWKGPLIGTFIEDLLKKSLWSPLDYLIVDTPPGTGDIPLSIFGSVKIDGAVLVTTPQDVAYDDVVRNIDMFKKMNVPILGVVQNLDGFVCPHCKKVTRIFKGNAGKRLAEKFKLEFLGSLAIDPSIAQAGDQGFPAVLKNPDSPFSQSLRTIAARIMMKVPKIPDDGETINDDNNTNNTTNSKIIKP